MRRRSADDTCINRTYTHSSSSPNRSRSGARSTFASLARVLACGLAAPSSKVLEAAHGQPRGGLQLQPAHARGQPVGPQAQRERCVRAGCQARPAQDLADGSPLDVPGGDNGPAGTTAHAGIAADTRRPRRHALCGLPGDAEAAADLGEGQTFAPEGGNFPGRSRRNELRRRRRVLTAASRDSDLEGASPMASPGCAPTTRSVSRPRCAGS
jgi:hypothetical protein